MGKPMREGCCLALIVTAWLICVAGCATSRGGVGHARLTASTAPLVADIPVPVGFEIVDEASEDWSEGTMRYLRHRFRGVADKYAVRRFYGEQMPLVRWSLLSDSQVHGRITLRFERENETCNVAIEDDSAGFARRVIVEIVIVPRAR